MRGLRALYLAGIISIALILIGVFLNFQVQPPVTSTPEVEHFTTELGTGFIVGFNIRNPGDKDQNYTFGIISNGKNRGENTVLIKPGGRFRFQTYYSTNRTENRRANMLVYRGYGYEKELIDNTTHLIIANPVP